MPTPAHAFQPLSRRSLKMILAVATMNRIAGSGKSGVR